MYKNNREALKKKLVELVSFAFDSSDSSDWMGVNLLHDQSDVEEEIEKLIQWIEKEILG